MSLENQFNVSIGEQFKKQSEQVFDEAVKIFVRETVKDSNVPVDTTALQQGIKKTSEGKLTATVESTTTNSGFDYPEHLDSTGLGGHGGWWEKTMRQEAWEAAIREAALKVGL